MWFFDTIVLFLFLIILVVTMYCLLSGSLDNGNKGENIAWLSDPASKVHIGVGCDFCGVKAGLSRISVDMLFWFCVLCFGFYFLLFIFFLLSLVWVGDCENECEYC